MIGAGNDKQVNLNLLPPPNLKHMIWSLRQFRQLAEKILRQPALVDDPKFSSNGARVKNRTELVQIIANVLEQQNRNHWIDQFTGLGCVIFLCCPISLLMLG